MPKPRMRQSFVLPCLVLILCTFGSEAATIPGVATNKTLTLGYLLSWSHEWAAGPYIGSSLVLGIEEVEKRQLLPGYDIDWILEDTWCQSGQGIKAATEVWFKAQDLDALIGGACSVVCLPVSLLAAAWGVPVVSYGCASDLLSDKVTYPTFSRTVGLYVKVANILHDISEVFQWNRIGIVTDSADLFLRMAQQLEIMLEASGKETRLYIAESTTTETDIELRLYKLRRVLRLLKSSCRIIYVAMYSLDFRNLLAMAYEEDMMTGFVYMGPEAELPLGMVSDFRPDLGSEIYEGVVDTEVSVPEGLVWDNFRQEVIDSFQSPKFDGWEHIGPNASIEVVNSFAGLIHDAILLWAYGVNKTLQQGYAPDDGLKILTNMVNMTFEGITGKVTIDEKGDRISDYTIRMTQNGTMVSILHYMAAQGTFIKTYKPHDENDWTGLLWPGNYEEVPSDRPACGWRNELCIVPDNTGTGSLIAAVSAMALLVFVVGTGILVLRKHRFEKQLQEAASCLVAWAEIEELNMSNGSQTTLRSMVTSGSNQVQRQFCPVVRFKSDVLAVKSLGSTRINLTDRKVLLELKIMKELHHENLNSFIGICLEPPHACVFMVYAPRGSLQDVIAYTDTILTFDFKLSLAMDIARGMNALHASEPGWHGHLTSSNCVVDSRWVCKITDYGLHHIRYGSSSSSTCQLMPDSLLWTAPELLDQISHIPGTKKGDVYSYGIIIQELLLQSSPYCENGPDLTAEEIIKKVKGRSSPPFRPVILAGSCSSDWLELMKSCWEDIPNMRPHFSQILSMLRTINGGQDCTLVDGMIQRLEMYSTQLESIVALRTLELLEEKDKLERLLLELLPKSITDSLKLGRKVEPESFDSATIFFSDVVGFTRISAAGTPLDVVRMLNLMYTVFDDIAEKFDVYKVATIGDAYFVASGVPLRNGNKHAAEISNMATELLRAVSKLAIPHLPHEYLKLRIGIHTGPCLAGVVGVKMPRYLLFGDTIDVASQMESKGETMKIHISSFTADILPHGSFLLRQREDKIEVKGHGAIKTYWLMDTDI